MPRRPVVARMGRDATPAGGHRWRGADTSVRAFELVCDNAVWATPRWISPSDAVADGRDRSLLGECRADALRVGGALRDVVPAERSRPVLDLLNHPDDLGVQRDGDLVAGGRGADRPGRRLA